MPPHATKSGVRASGAIRIIGGQWRRRLIPVPDRPGLRPTPDRVRETLFNWLQPVIEGSRCLDLFAGSGALGFEAASRGAAEVVAVERDPSLVPGLKAVAAQLGAATIGFVQADAVRWLQAPGDPFDIVFLDPPFREGLAHTCCALLEARGWLAPKAHIYIEAERELVLTLPPSWHIQKEGKAGEVRYYLARNG
jgi:16S rRNA (guanine966-N2)-methyltransferase